MIKYSVRYYDDFNVAHMVFIKSLSEFYYIRDRFLKATILEVF